MLGIRDLKVKMSKFLFEKKAYPYTDAIVLFSKIRHYELLIAHEIKDA